jgi:hypothetical protein
MNRQTSPTEFAGSIDRRRIPRYFCGGLAQITCLPSYDSLVRGRIRDLGLGGCCIECTETVPRLDLGDRTEILVEVNSWFFRAMANVRAIRGRAGLSMEFTRMSAGGSGVLADLIADLERSRTVAMNQKRLVEGSRQIVHGNSGAGQRLTSARHDSIAIVGTIMPANSAEERSSAASRHAWLWDVHPPAVSIDILV